MGEEVEEKRCDILEEIRDAKDGYVTRSDLIAIMSDAGKQIESLRASLTRVEEERDARPTIEEWSNEIDRVRDHWKGKLTAQAQDVLSVINPILQGPAGVELSSAQCEQLVLLEDRLSRPTLPEGK